MRITIILLLLLFTSCRTFYYMDYVHYPNHYAIYMEILADANKESQRVKLLFEQRVDRIMAALKAVESSNRYHVHGQSGEYGAYQFMPKTWERFCKYYFGEILDITDPANQDAVARERIKDLIFKGYSDEQIANIWNSN
jgi:muramidase (phage lysozyme)